METIVLSLGGSLIVPDGIDVEFLKKFRDLIISQTKKGKKFVVISGGGKVCRRYQEAAKALTQVSNDDLDWIGIASTRLNSELLRVVFGESAFEKIVMDPNMVPQTDKPVILGGGWKPGNSSDLAATQAALSIGAKKLINLSNIDYLYDKDPNKYTDAKKIEQISWSGLIEILPKSWEPGANVPFDPIAAKEAEVALLEVAILNGKNISNLEKYLNGEDFAGTQIK
ncbi:MAG: UMP kinase [bacterium]